MSVAETGEAVARISRLYLGHWSQSCMAKVEAWIRAIVREEIQKSKASDQ